MLKKDVFQDPRRSSPVDEEIIDTYIRILARAIGRTLSHYTKIISGPDYGDPKKTRKARTKVADELGSIRERVAKDFGRKAKINNIIFQLTEKIHGIEEQFASKLAHDHSNFETRGDALASFKETVLRIADLFDDTFDTSEKNNILVESKIASAA